ncbi:MAG TPA: hypothetical protein VLS93_06495 [Anaeromyxobacteraceae bacterium]|nr:hypothetical protein [Anaeromyxobacteraceae bacterium]
MLAALGRLFDGLEAFWEGTRTRRAVAAVLVLVFLGDVLLIELGRRGLLPGGLALRFPRNHFRAVEVAFTLLLAFEVVGLAFALARSVTAAAGKQIEIFSLILLRHSFEEFGYLDEPVTWEGARESVLHMVANGFGALALFVVLGFYYAAQRHRPLSDDAKETRGFVGAKKTISLVLVGVFAVLAARSLVGEGAEFFESFYTVLVLADVLLVLVSLRYSGSYHVVFRNSGLAVATVLLRLALSAPVYWNAALGLAAAFFALGLTLAGNRFAPLLRRAPERESGSVRAGGS